MTKPNPSRVAHRHEAVRRVARRHMAGLFDAPPRVLKAVEDWALGVYAGHVLALIEKQIDTPPDDTEKRLAQTQKYLQGELTEKMNNMSPGDLLRIPAGRNTDVVLKLPDLSGTEFEYSYEDHFQFVVVKKGQRAKFPRAPNRDSSKYSEYAVGWDKAEDNWENDSLDFTYSMAEPYKAGNDVEVILQKGLETYSKEVRRNVRQNMDPTRLVELGLMRQEAKKYTSKSKSYKNKARTTLPLDLSGWKYLVGMPASEVEKKQVEKKFTSFTCILNFKPHKRRGGQWSPSDMTMELDLWSGMNRPRTLKDFRKGLQRIRDIARHETIHVGQDALRIVKGLRGDGGMPSESIQDGFGRRKRLPHPRRDVEFYTRLADEVSRFTVEIKSIPLPKRRGFLRKWFDTRKFFKVNKKHNPGKWKKMVGEFISEIGKAGVYIPSATNVSETADVAETATIGPDTTIQGSPKVEGQAKVLGAATVKDSARLTQNAVVKDNAVVSGSAIIAQSANISGNAQVTGGIVGGSAKVSGDAKVSGGFIGNKAKVSGEAIISGDPRVHGTVYGKGKVTGTAVVEDGATVSGGEITDRAFLGGKATLYTGLIRDEAKVLDKAEIRLDSIVRDFAEVKDYAYVEGATVGGNATISGNAQVYGGAVVAGRSRIEGNARVTGGRWNGEHVTSGFWAEPPKYPVFREGDVVYLKPRGSSQYREQWVIVGEVLGRGLEQEHNGVIRVPNRYALWKLDADRKDVTFIGDWDDFDFDISEKPSGTMTNALKRAWNRYAA